MVIRYTEKEWNNLKTTEQAQRLDLAPEHLERKLNDQRNQISTLFQGFKMGQCKIEVLLALVEAQEQILDTEALAEKVDEFNLDSIDILMLIAALKDRYTTEKSNAARAKHKDDIWLTAVLEQYCERELEFNTLDEFCEDVAGTTVSTRAGLSTQAPAHATIKRKLTRKEIDLYKRRNGIS